MRQLEFWAGSVFNLFMHDSRFILKAVHTVVIITKHGNMIRGPCM